MASVRVEGLEKRFSRALDRLGAAVRDCPDGLWEQPMWHEPSPAADHQFLRADWTPISEPGQRDILAERWALRWPAPWSVAWHALETLDYDLTGGFGPWAPPGPFAGHPHWRDLATLSRAWTKDEIAGYLEHGRGRVATTLAGLTEEGGSRPLPAGHRYAGQPHRWLIAGLVGHTAEHAAQIAALVAGERLGDQGRRWRRRVSVEGWSRGRPRALEAEQKKGQPGVRGSGGTCEFYHNSEGRWEGGGH